MAATGPQLTAYQWDVITNLNMEYPDISTAAILHYLEAGVDLEDIIITIEAEQRPTGDQLIGDIGDFDLEEEQSDDELVDCGSIGFTNGLVVQLVDNKVGLVGPRGGMPTFYAVDDQLEIGTWCEVNDETNVARKLPRPLTETEVTDNGLIKIRSFLVRNEVGYSMSPLVGKVIVENRILKPECIYESDITCYVNSPWGDNQMRDHGTVWRVTPAAIVALVKNRTKLMNAETLMIKAGWWDHLGVDRKLLDPRNIPVVKKPVAVQCPNTKGQEERKITMGEGVLLMMIIDGVDHDKFTHLVDLLPDVDFSWILKNVGRGSIDAIVGLAMRDQDNTVPKRMRRRSDNKGITNLVELCLRLESTFKCAACREEVPKKLGVPCLLMDGDASPHEQHHFCKECVRKHAEVAVESASTPHIVNGIKCMQTHCDRLLIYKHVSPLLQKHCRELVEDEIAPEALVATDVNVEWCLRCPFAAIVDLPITAQPTFLCRRCSFEHCRNCDREWSARHVGKRCEELNLECIRRKNDESVAEALHKMKL